MLYQFDSVRLGEKCRHQLLSVMRIHDKDTRKELCFQPARYFLLQTFQNGKRHHPKGELPLGMQSSHVIYLVISILVPLKKRCSAPILYGNSLWTNLQVKLFQRQLPSLGKAQAPICDCTVVSRMEELVPLNIEDTRYRSLMQTNTSGFCNFFPQQERALTNDHLETSWLIQYKRGLQGGQLISLNYLDESGKVVGI